MAEGDLVLDTRDAGGRFIKGQSGNPAGRAVIAQHGEIQSIQQEIELAMRKQVPAEDIVKVIRATVKDAQRGDAKARKLVFEYFIGKPKAPEEVADKSGGVVIRIENATFKAQTEEQPALEGQFTEVKDNG